MDDLFYKKDEAVGNANSATEEDLWDEQETVVAEVKKNSKKPAKFTESDFENDMADKKEPAKKM